MPKTLGDLFAGMLVLFVSSTGAVRAQPVTFQEDSVQLVGGPPLSRIVQLVVGPDSSAYLLDAMTPGVLEYDVAGAFVRQLGREGEGPGEFRSPWRIGMIGRDTLWVADLSLRRFTLFDASTGESLRTIPRSEAWGAWEPRATPLALSASRSPILVVQETEESPIRVFGFEPGNPEPKPVVTLDEDNRFMEVPLADGAIHLRAPFSHHDKFAVDPWSRMLIVLREPDAGGRLGVEPHAFDSEHRVAGGFTVQLEAEPLAASAIEEWLDKQKMMEDFVGRGFFPSLAAARETFEGSLFTPKEYPLIASRGQGVLDSGVIIDPLDPVGTVWIQRAGRSEEQFWQRISPGGVSPKLRLGLDETLLAALGDLLWVARLDRFGVPTVIRRRISPEGEENE
ncbi:MAG: hypothetical protein PVJ76_06585 [Gemmatimonadota bacterium]|jgi:hypothetical protein